jgi:hypothetical protein
MAMAEPAPERTPPFPEIDPDDNEVFLDALHEITTRWSAGEITSAQATSELRDLEARHGR